MWKDADPDKSGQHKKRKNDENSITKNSTW